MTSFRPPWYTLEELSKLWSELWKVSISATMLYRSIEAGKLVLSERWVHDASGDRWIDLPLESGNDTSNLNNSGFEFEGRYVRLKEAERFEKERRRAVVGEQSSTNTTETNKTVPPLKSGGGQEGLSSRPRELEKPLSTMKAIAIYCGVHESTVKDWRKRHNDFPASQRGSGRVTALPSELNAWMVRKKKQ